MAAILAIPGLIVVCWLGGFAWFLQAARPPSATAPWKADGIVALTGGADRVETALHLLAEGRGRLLLVSGVGGAIEFADLARRAGIDAALGARVTLGRAAVSTHGNAVETADWARANRLGSLLVVTAAYHMPRALAELGRMLPNIALYSVPVVPSETHAAPPLRLLAAEYTKYLVAAFGLSALMPVRSEAPTESSRRAAGV